MLSLPDAGYGPETEDPGCELQNNSARHRDSMSYFLCCIVHTDKFRNLAIIPRQISLFKNLHASLVFEQGEFVNVFFSHEQIEIAKSCQVKLNLGPRPQLSGYF